VKKVCVHVTWLDAIGREGRVVSGREGRVVLGHAGRAVVEAGL
jgi:hypothetical protein